MIEVSRVRRVFVSPADEHVGGWSVCYGTDQDYERMSPEAAVHWAGALLDAARDALALDNINFDSEENQS